MIGIDLGDSTLAASGRAEETGGKVPADSKAGIEAKDAIGGKLGAGV